MGGAASSPRSRVSERRGGGGRALLFPLLLRSSPRAVANHPLSNSSAESRGPRSLSRACVPLIAGEAASGAPEWYGLGPERTRRWRRTGFQGPLPRPRPPTCPWPRPPPQLRPMGSFIPSGALYKYLPSAPGVPSARPGATGVRRKESRLALPAPHWQSERDRGIQTAVEAAGGVWMVRWSVKAPRRDPPAP